MTNKYSLKLNTIETKVMNELDILTDAMVSTFNKIGNTIQDFSKDASDIFGDFIKKNKNWKIEDKQSFDISFMPFLDYYSYCKEFSVESLDTTFYIGGQKNLKRDIRDKKQRLNNLLFTWWFAYDIRNQNRNKYFGFEIREDKSNQIIFSEKDYNTISKKIKRLCKIKEDVFFELEHPDGKNLEYYKTLLDYEYFDKLSMFFKICKEELIINFLSKIND